MYSGIYTSNVFEYMIIEAASHIAKEGAFIIPQMSAPFVYSGTDCSRWLKEGRARRFEKQTGITLDFNVGIDTSNHKDRPARFASGYLAKLFSSGIHLNKFPGGEVQSF